MKDLAQLLYEETDFAISTLNQITSEDAYFFYLKAILSARNNNDNEVFSNLTKAINKNSALKDYAKNDIEFRNYFEDDTFEAIVQ